MPRQKSAPTRRVEGDPDQDEPQERPILSLFDVDDEDYDSEEDLVSQL